MNLVAIAAPDDGEEPCNHPQHNPPKNTVGEHTCPNCGKKTKAKTTFKWYFPQKQRIV